MPGSFKLLQLTDTYISGFVSSQEELEDVLDCHSRQYLTSFVTWSDDINKQVKDKKKRRLLWKSEGFAGNVPISINRRKIYMCQYGKAYKCSRTATQKVQHGHHDYLRKKRFLVQNTKKMNCQAKIFVRYITRYDDYQVEEQASQRQRSAKLAILEAKLTENSVQGTNVIHVKLPQIAAHDTHKVSLESGFSKHIHPEVRNKIDEYVAQGIISVPLIRKTLEHFVYNELCPDSKPLKHDRCYFPTNRTIRNYIHLALCKGRFSKFDQLNLEEKVKAWQNEDKQDCFFLRKCSDKSKQTAVSDVRIHRKPKTQGFVQEIDDRDDDIYDTRESTTFLFIHQTSQQQLLLKRYGDMVLIDATYKTTKYALPLFLVVVRTNVGYSPVAEFITEDETTVAITEALDIIKRWNPEWNPKFFMLDYSEQEYQALQAVFPGTRKFLCAFHREQAWLRWSKDGKNQLNDEDKQEFLQRLRKVAVASTKDSCTTEMTNLRSSALYKRNSHVKDYLESRWFCIPEHTTLIFLNTLIFYIYKYFLLIILLQRWCRAYGPEDFCIAVNTNNGVEALNNALKSFYLSLSCTGTISSLVELLVTEFVPEQVLSYTQKNYSCSSQYKAYSKEIPDYLHNRPRNFVTTCLKRILAAFHYTKADIKEISSSKFLVKSETTSQEYVIDLGDNDRYPSCDCISFRCTFLPCKHMFAVFKFTDATWDSLSPKYRNCPYLNLDDDFLSTDALSKCSIPGTSDSYHDDLTHTQPKTVTKKLTSTCLASPDLRKAQVQLRGELKVLMDSSYLCQDVPTLLSASTQLQQLSTAMKRWIPLEGNLPLHQEKHVVPTANLRELPKRRKRPQLTRKQKRKRKQCSYDDALPVKQLCDGYTCDGPAKHHEQNGQDNANLQRKQNTHDSAQRTSDVQCQAHVDLKDQGLTCAAEVSSMKQGTNVDFQDQEQAISNEGFQRRVQSYKTSNKLQQLMDFISTVHLILGRQPHDCVTKLNAGSLPPANSIMYEAGLEKTKLDFVLNIISGAAADIIKTPSLSKQTDLFQLLVATILIAASNNLSFKEIEEMFKIQPSHLIQLEGTTCIKPGKGKFRVGNTTFQESDLDSLNHGKWLNDQVIHAYLNLLMSEHPGKVYMFSSFLSLKWQSGAYNDWLYKKVDLTKFRWLFVPIFHSHHWFLLAADTISNTVYVLNSLDKPKEDEIFYHHWCKYINARNKVVAHKISAMKWVSYSKGQQLDGSSCGVFLLMNAEAILNNVPAGLMRQHHVKTYRKYVQKRLLMSARSNKNSICDMPFCVKPDGSNIKWVQCDACDRWCHLCCSALTSVDKSASFFCIYCS
ncbi:uncharacterized protein [Apostichopus japonicus]|uniref:uncharacterized protein n=1 Tax=Stichopus japonicus TaxID=307972 RepID=UPI003AB10FAC